MNLSFELIHIGINIGIPDEAHSLAAQLSDMFHLNPKHGDKSEFAGAYIACRKAPSYGTNGHIAMGTANVDTAVVALTEKGCAFNKDTGAYNDDGTQKNIYLNGGFGGFLYDCLK